MLRYFSNTFFRNRLGRRETVGCHPAVAPLALGHAATTVTRTCAAPSATPQQGRSDKQVGRSRRTRAPCALSHRRSGLDPALRQLGAARIEAEVRGGQRDDGGSRRRHGPTDDESTTLIRAAFGLRVRIIRISALRVWCLVGIQSNSNLLISKGLFGDFVK